MSEQNGNFGGLHIFAAFLGGAVAGATVALLTSPQSGRENRATIKGYVQDQSHNAAKLPAAVQAASGAAKDAFAESMQHGNGQPT
jgi:gas vesicle protein